MARGGSSSLETAIVLLLHRALQKSLMYWHFWGWWSLWLNCHHLRVMNGFAVPEFKIGFKNHGSGAVCDWSPIRVNLKHLLLPKPLCNLSALITRCHPPTPPHPNSPQTDSHHQIASYQRNRIVMHVTRIFPHDGCGGEKNEDPVLPLTFRSGVPSIFVFRSELLVCPPKKTRDVTTYIDTFTNNSSSLRDAAKE